MISSHVPAHHLGTSHHHLGVILNNHLEAYNTVFCMGVLGQVMVSSKDEDKAGENQHNAYHGTLILRGSRWLLRHDF